MLSKSVRLPVFLAAIFLHSLVLLSQQTSTTSISATPVTASVGQAVAISATVVGQNNTIPIPSGSVSFVDGSTPLGSVSLSSLAVTTPRVVSFSQLFSGSQDLLWASRWADLNGDGKPDLLAYSNLGAIQVFLNNGNQTFTALAPQNFSNSATNIALIDFNGDGKIDILSMTPTGLVQVAYGNGDGTFQPSVAAPGITPTSNGTALIVSALAVADLTGSGLSDIILGNTLSGLGVNASISIYKNNGQGSFTSLGNFPVSSQSVNSQTINQILPVDMNGDGKLDVAVTIATGVALDSYVSAAVLLNNGDGTLTPPTATLPPVTYNEIGSVSSLVAGDFANRGKTDLAFLSNNEIDLYPGNGDGTLAPSILVTSSGNSYQLATEDLNGDGKLDLIDAGGIAYLGNGDFTFTPTANLLTSEVSNFGNAGTLLVADIDGDGVPDLLFNYNDNTGHQAVTIQLGSRSAIAVLPPTSSLTVGVHPIVANYAGDGTFSSSTSPAVNVTVNKFTSTVSGAATPNPALSTQSITLTVQVSSAGPVPTGSVNFTEGSTILGTATLDSHGAGSTNVTFGTAASHNVTVSYPGDAANLPSTASLSAVTVANFPSNIALIAAPNPSVVGQPLVLSAFVTPTGSSPIPTGNVVFLSGSAQLGSAPLDSTGKTAFTTSFSAIGNQTVTANYVGDAANQPSSAAVVEAVLSAFDFQPTTGNPTITVTSGSSAALPITVSSQNGFSGSVSFTCSNLPNGATCSFSPANVTVSSSTPGAVTLTVSTASIVSSNSTVSF